MTFTGVNYLAVLVAALTAWLIGAAWYMIFAEPWMAAHGWRNETDMLGPGAVPSLVPFVLAFLAELVMAWVLAELLGHLGHVTIRNGIMSGVVIWLGFVVTAMAVNSAFSRRKAMLTAIDSGHWLVVLIVMGAILGAFGA